MTHMFYSHRRKDLQTQDCDICGKYFTKNTVAMMHKFRHSEAKSSLEGELKFCEKLFPKPISQMSYMLTNTGEKVYKTAALKTHKFCHSGAKTFLEGKL